MVDRHGENSPADLVQVGRIVGAYGVRGWIKLEAFARPDSVLHGAKSIWIDRGRANANAPTELSPDLNSLRQLTVAALREQGDLLVAQLTEIADRDAAQALKAARIWMRRAQFPTVPDGEYYWVDLIGCSVINARDEPLGVIAALEDHGADPVMRIEHAASASAAPPVIRLIPFVQAYVDKVDLAKKQVTVQWEAQWDTE